MNIEVKYQVCGTTEDGYDWQADTLHDTFEEAEERVAHWERYEPTVWIEKITTTREIIKSISSAPKEAWPV